jgi:hypothetical protein
MYKKVKQLLNSLRCPICGAQIERFCVINSDHYKVFLNRDNYNIETDSIRMEQVEIYNDKHHYQIRKYHNTQPILTVITIYNANAEGIIYDNKYKHLDIKQDLFDFRDFNIKKAINRIKTILTFQ